VIIFKKYLSISSFHHLAKVCVTNNEGVTAIEYAMIGALIAAIIVGAVTAVGTDAGNLYNTIQAAFP